MEFEFTEDNGYGVRGFYFSPRHEEYPDYIEWETEIETLSHWCGKAPYVDFYAVEEGHCSNCKKKVPDFILLFFNLKLHLENPKIFRPGSR